MKKIKISGQIGWDISPEDIISELDSAAGDDLDVMIASPGGSVFQGIQIYNAFRDYKRKNPSCQIMATITGLAASMASYLAVNPAFDLVAAEDNAVFMIHNASGGAIGDYRDMQKMSDLLSGLTDLLAQAYSDKIKKSKKEIRSLMDNETWYFGNDILVAGFVDEIIKTDGEKDTSALMASAKLQFDEMQKKLNSEKIEITEIAAVLKTEHNPASDAGENKPEVITMTLKEFLDSNPAAKAEYEAALAAQNEAGVKKGKEDYIASLEPVTNYLNSEEYPKQIKDVAIGVIMGKKSLETLDTMVASVDMFKELNKSIEAKKETDENGDTGKDKELKLSENGEIKSTDDYAATIARMKSGNGVEVN